MIDLQIVANLAKICRGGLGGVPLYKFLRGGAVVSVGVS